MRQKTVNRFKLLLIEYKSIYFQILAIIWFHKNKYNVINKITKSIKVVEHAHR